MNWKADNGSEIPEPDSLAEVIVSDGRQSEITESQEEGTGIACNVKEWRSRRTGSLRARRLRKADPPVQEGGSVLLRPRGASHGGVRCEDAGKSSGSRQSMGRERTTLCLRCD
jgi:hypothetical protein